MLKLLFRTGPNGIWSWFCTDQFLLKWKIKNLRLLISKALEFATGFNTCLKSCPDRLLSRFWLFLLYFKSTRASVQLTSLPLQVRQLLYFFARIKNNLIPHKTKVFEFFFIKYSDYDYLNWFHPNNKMYNLYFGKLYNNTRLRLHWHAVRLLLLRRVLVSLKWPQRPHKPRDLCVNTIQHSHTSHCQLSTPYWCQLGGKLVVPTSLGAVL